jgi:hypothetical protein
MLVSTQYYSLSISLNLTGATKSARTLSVQLTVTPDTAPRSKKALVLRGLEPRTFVWQLSAYQHDAITIFATAPSLDRLQQWRQRRKLNSGDQKFYINPMAWMRIWIRSLLRDLDAEALQLGECL